MKRQLTSRAPGVYCLIIFSLIYEQISETDCQAGLYPEMWSGGSSAEGTRMEAPKASTVVGSGEGVFPSPVGVGSGRDCQVYHLSFGLQQRKVSQLLHSIKQAMGKKQINVAGCSTSNK